LTLRWPTFRSRVSDFRSRSVQFSISHLGGIFNLQFLAQPPPAVFTSAHVGSDSYNVALICVLFCRLCPVLPARSCMYACASCTLP
jgi:hypothetical protein